MEPPLCSILKMCFSAISLVSSLNAMCGDIEAGCDPPRALIVISLLN